MQFVIGLDEVGTGSLCAEALVGAVRMPKDWTKAGVKDSKDLSAKKREQLVESLMYEVEYHLEPVSLSDINTLGLFKAVDLAFEKSIAALYKSEDMVILDGKRQLKSKYPITSIINADDSVPQVSAAAILAKVLRDQYIITCVDPLYPQYNWKKNKGYASKEHKAAIKQYGLTPLHRNYKIKL